MVKSWILGSCVEKYSSETFQDIEAWLLFSHRMKVLMKYTEVSILLKGKIGFIYVSISDSFPICL